ncbi:hypothetical protein RCH07_003334 [Arthrobacter sp. CG_A4]|nr:hypothetical protein [Arthrobacter sp. CG_A4]
MGLRRNVASHRARGRLRLAAVFCGLPAILLIVLGWFGLIFVIGGVVVPALTISTVLSAAAVVLAVLDRRNRTKAKDRAPFRNFPWPSVFAVQVLIFLAVAGCVLAILGDASHSTKYRVLTPAGPDGCQAVVLEGSFFIAGRGEVFAVHPLGIGWRAGSWTTDDGIRPIEEGQYELSWGVAGGALLVRGDGNNPVWPALHEVTCSKPDA